MTTISSVPLNWEDSDAWSTDLESLAPEVFNESVIDCLTKETPEYITSDDLSWLGRILPRDLRETCDLRSEVLGRLRSHFTHLVAYHGRRPISLDSYRRTGIGPLDATDAHDELVQKVCGVSASGPTEKEVREACALADATYRQGRVFFEASRRHLLDFCGHYLLYGSEYAVGILRSSSRYPDHAQLLKLQGRPTLLTCNVPLRWLQQGTQEELTGTLISAYFKKKLYSGYKHPQQCEGFGFEIYQTLTPELINEVEYPEHVHDPIAVDA